MAVDGLSELDVIESIQNAFVIRKLTRNRMGDHKGQTYVVPRLTYFECPKCGERLYDRGAMRKIQNYSPAYRHLRSYRKSA